MVITEEWVYRYLWCCDDAAGALILYADRLVVASEGELECFSMPGESLWVNHLPGKGYGATTLGLPERAAAATPP